MTVGLYDVCSHETLNLYSPFTQLAIGRLDLVVSRGAEGNAGAVLVEHVHRTQDAVPVGRPDTRPTARVTQLTADGQRKQVTLKYNMDMYRNMSNKTIQNYNKHFMLFNSNYSLFRSSSTPQCNMSKMSDILFSSANFITDNYMQH